MRQKSSSQGKGKKELDPTHAEWLVGNRAETQRVSAKLYRLLKEHQSHLGKFSLGTQMLVSISFSLWRSAFLSAKTGKIDDTNESAMSFLSEMLESNAITYAQEWNAKDFTFNYYAWNAQKRLEVLQALWPNAKLGSLVAPEGEKITPKSRWGYLQSAFEKAVDHFEKRLIAAKNGNEISGW